MYIPQVDYLIVHTLRKTPFVIDLVFCTESKDLIDKIIVTVPTFFAFFVYVRVSQMYFRRLLN
jgi:hypothetical protein